MAGEVNVEAMLRRITAKQFKAWAYYESMEPFGDLRADYRIATVVQMIANVNLGKDQKPITLQECLLQFKQEEEKPRQRQSVAHQLAIAHAVVMAYSKPALPLK